MRIGEKWVCICVSSFAIVDDKEKNYVVHTFVQEGEEVVIRSLRYDVNDAKRLLVYFEVETGNDSFCLVCSSTKFLSHFEKIHTEGSE